MTWQHVAAIALAVVLVLGCGMSHVCSSNAEALGHVTQLATGIVAGVIGHASHRQRAFRHTHKIKRSRTNAVATDGKTAA